MKKFLCLALALTICFSLVACGNDNATKDDETENQTQSQTNNEKDDNKTNDDYVADPDLPGTLKVNVTTVQYCVDAPFTLQKRAGTGYLFKDEQIAVVYDHYLDGATSEKYNVNLESITSADKVLEGMKNQVINACSEALIRADEITFEINKSESKTVNGKNMCRYEGKFLLNHKYPLDYNEANFVAYSMIKDNCPVYFVVIDITSEQANADIANTADKIAKTFREYSED